MITSEMSGTKKVILIQLAVWRLYFAMDRIVLFFCQVSLPLRGIRGRDHRLQPMEFQFPSNQDRGFYFKRPSTLVAWSLNFSLSLVRRVQAEIETPTD